MTQVKNSSIKSPRRMYDSLRWRKARHTFLLSHPLCAMCESIKRLTPSEVVDHIIPHKESMTLFWDKNNWQALCKRCHDSHKQHHEKSNVYGCDAQGFPIDPRSHWNALDKS